MNHAFLIMAHREPKLVKRIVSQLIDNNHFFFIHVDKKVDLLPFKKELALIGG